MVLGMRIYFFYIFCFTLIFSETHSEITKINSNINELILEFRPKLISFQEIETGQEKFFIPLIENAHNIETRIGKPQQFAESVLITVSSPKGFTISFVEISNIKSFSYTMAATGIDLPNFNNNSRIYQQENRIPDWISLEYIGISRGRHIARLSFIAARWNYETRQIEIPEKITVKINFTYNQQNKAQILDKFAPKLTINHDETYAFVLSESAPRTQSQRLTDLNQVSNGNWLRLTITDEGLYRLDANQLAARGFRVPADLVKTIKLFGHGGANLSEKVSDGLQNDMFEQPIIVQTKQNGELEAIIFYATGAKGFTYENNDFVHYRNDFSFNNYYLLTFGGHDGKRYSTNPTPDGAINYQPESYYHRIFYNEETTNPYPDGSGRTYLGRSFFGTPFMDILYNLKRDENIIYRISLAHRATQLGAVGRFVVKQSGRQILNYTLNDTYGDYVHINRSIQKVIVPADFVGTDGRSVLTIEYQNSFAGAVPYFDFYEIHYPRQFIPIDNELSFFSDPTKSGITEYRINGFTNNPIIGIDLTNPRDPILLENLAKTGGMFIFRKNETRNLPSKYFISSKFKSVPVIEQIKLANLRGTIKDVDVIVITHPQFIESANEYANYRRSKNNLKVAVVKVDDIYKEFSSTIPDITAIRDFIAYVYQVSSIKPSFVVLWGDAHYDYRNIQIKSPLFIPMYMNKESEFFITETSTIATDDYIACVDGNDWLCDVAFGRVPISSLQDGKTYLKKIKHYENNSSFDNWRTNILLVADDSYTSKGQDGDIHTRQSEELSAKLPQELLQKKVYLAAYPSENIAGGKRRKPGVNKEFISTANTSGALIFNWIGHGNPRVLAHEEFFERETTIPQLSNYDKLFFVTAATCDFGRFDLVGPRSGAEELIFSKTGGAIAVFTATRVVGAYANHALNQKFYQSLFTRKQNGLIPTIGEAAFIAKQTFYDENSRRFLILGDPLLALNFPQLQIKIDSINGKSIVEQDTFQLKGLSKVEITAHIADEFGVCKINNFDGTAVFTLLDGDETRSIIDEFGIKYRFNIQGAMLARATFEVKNGIVNISFVIPKDISFSESNARIFIYAYSMDGRTAAGAFQNIKVYGIDTTLANDNRGPEIEIYLDNYAFKPGDIVRREPLLIVELNDETGINSTGLGVGHNIEAYINDNPIALNLTPYFNTSLENVRSGVVKYFLSGLAPGLHKIKVRAWDVFNNPNEAETYFQIPADNEIKIFNVFLYPNPFSGTGKIDIIHNFTPPFTIDLSIYNITGELVKELKSTWTSQEQTTIEFDGCDNDGRLLPLGSYYYYIRLYNSSGKIEKSGSLGVKVK